MDERTPRPTHADLRAYMQLKKTRLESVLAEAKVWRNGYAMLASGAGATVALVGVRLGESTPWGWRLALTGFLGGGLIFVAWALWLVLTIEGGRRSATIELRELIAKHNSFTMYEVWQADAALKRLARSKWMAGVGALLCFLGLIVTLWVPSPAPAGVPTAVGSVAPSGIAPSASPAPVASASSPSPVPTVS